MKNKNYKITTKLILLILVIIFTFLISSIISTDLMTEKLLGEFWTSDVKIKSEVMNNLIIELKDKALLSTEWFESSARLVATFKENDRNSAIKLGRLALKSMSLDYMVITDLEGKVFIRAHDPEKFGDSIAKQVNIQKALKGERSVGIEEGTVVKFSIRAGCPLREKNGQIIGAISLGYVLSNNDLLDKYKKIIGCDLSIYSGNERISTTFIKDGKRVIGTKLDNKEILDTVLKNGKAYQTSEKISGLNFNSAYLPIIDVNGKITGILFIGKESTIISNLTETLIKNLVIILTGISILAIIFFIYFSNKYIKKPIKKLRNFVETVSNGVLDERFDISSKDEIGEIGESINSMTEKFETLIGLIIQSSNDLSSAIYELAKGNEDLSKRTISQASSLEQIAATIDSANMSIKRNMDNSQSAEKIASDAVASASEGEKIISETVASINEINSTSKKISEIVEIINEISFQTNLLALNAAVEAAKAGEHGRSFAVVAGEVRNLAQKSGNASKQIEALIKDSLEKIKTGTDYTVKSSLSFSQIIESVKKINSIIIEVSSAGKDLWEGMNQINTSVKELDNMTQSNSSLVEETSSASEEMASQAHELLNMIKAFKIRKNIQIK